MIIQTIIKDSTGAINQLGILSKSIHDIQRDLSTGHGKIYSIFGGTHVTKADITAIQEYTKLIQSGVPIGKAWSQTMTNCSVAAKQQVLQCKNNTQALTELTVAQKANTISAKASAVAMKALSVAGNMLLAWGITKVIELAVKGFDKLIITNEELKESLEESKSSFESVTDELKNLESELKTTGDRLEELQKLADNNTISIADEKELELLKEQNEELREKIALKKELQIDEGKDLLKDAKKSANRTVLSSYQYVEGTLEQGAPQYASVLPEEELALAFEKYFNPDSLKASDVIPTEVIEEMYPIIEDVVEAYEMLNDAGYELSDSEKAHYEKLDALQEKYLLYRYEINGAKESFQALTDEYKKGILVQRLLDKGLSFSEAHFVLDNISVKDYDKFWDKYFSFTPPQLTDYATAEEYGKAYAEAWLNGVKSATEDENPDKTSLLSPEQVSSIKEYESLLEKIANIKASPDDYSIFELMKEFPQYDWSKYANGLESIDMAFRKIAGVGNQNFKGAFQILKDELKGIEGYDIIIEELQEKLLGLFDFNDYGWSENLGHYDFLSNLLKEVQSGKVFDKNELTDAIGDYDLYGDIKEVENGFTIDEEALISLINKYAEEHNESLQKVREALENSGVDPDTVLGKNSYKTLLDTSKNANEATFSEQIDWYAQSVDVLERKVSSLEGTLENTKGWENQKKVIKDVINAQTQLQSAYQQSQFAYSAKFQNVLNNGIIADQGLSSIIKKKIESGEEFSIQPFIEEKIKVGEESTKEQLYKSIQEAINWWNKSKDAENNKIQIGFEIENNKSRLVEPSLQTTFQEEIDWYAHSVNVLSDHVSDLESELDNVKGYDAQIEKINELITAQESLKSAYVQSYKAYVEEFNALLNSDELKETGLDVGKLEGMITSGQYFDIEEFIDQSIESSEDGTREKAYNFIQELIGWFQKAVDAENNAIELGFKIDNNELDILNKQADQYSSTLDLVETKFNEAFSSTDKRNVYENELVPAINDFYDTQIKIAEANDDLTEVEKLRIEQSNKLNDAHLDVLELAREEASAQKELTQLELESANSYEEKLALYDQLKKDAQNYYDAEIAIAKANNDVVEQKRLELEYAQELLRIAKENAQLAQDEASDDMELAKAKLDARTNGSLSSRDKLYQEWKDATDEYYDARMTEAGIAGDKDEQTKLRYERSKAGKDIEKQRLGEYSDYYSSIMEYEKNRIESSSSEEEKVEAYENLKKAFQDYYDTEIAIAKINFDTVEQKRLELELAQELHNVDLDRLNNSRDEKMAERELIEAELDSAKTLDEKFVIYKKLLKAISDEYDAERAIAEANEDAITLKRLELEEEQELSRVKAQEVDTIRDEYDSILSGFEMQAKYIETELSRTEMQGNLAVQSYYQQLYDNELINLSTLINESNRLTKALEDTGLTGGEEFERLQNDINDVTLAIGNSENELVKLENALREVDWNIFDFNRNQAQRVMGENDFLLDLLDNKKLIGDDGNFTDAGISSVGLHGVNFNGYLEESIRYTEELLDLEKQISESPNDTNLIKRYNEILEKKQEMIVAGESEKDAIADLVRDGYEAQKNALKELCDQYIEELELQKDIYDQQKKTANQTKRIAELRKMIGSTVGDTSEETRAQVQKWQVELEETNSNLESDQWNQYISEQREILNSIYDNFSEVLDNRSENTEQLFQSAMAQAQHNSDSIRQTVEDVAQTVGYDINTGLASLLNQSSLNTNLADIENRVKTDGASIANDVNQLSQQNAELTTDTEATKNNTEEAKNSIKSIVDGITTLQTTLDGIKDNTETTKDYAYDTKWSVETIASNVVDIKTNTDGLVDSISGVGDTISGIGLSLDTTNSLISMLKDTSNFAMPNVKFEAPDFSSLTTSRSGILENNISINIPLTNVTDVNSFLREFQSNPKVHNIIKDTIAEATIGGSSLAKYRHNI